MPWLHPLPAENVATSARLLSSSAVYQPPASHCDGVAHDTLRNAACCMFVESAMAFVGNGGLTTVCQAPPCSATASSSDWLWWLSAKSKPTAAQSPGSQQSIALNFGLGSLVEPAGALPAVALQVPALSLNRSGSCTEPLVV